MASIQIRCARRMRSGAPMFERRLWRLLRDRHLAGTKFRRQVPIGPYIVDFACFRHRLVVEADGPFHDPEKDAIRDRWLGAQGFRVFRFDNGFIDKNLELVLKQLEDASAAPPVDDPWPHRDP